MVLGTHFAHVNTYMYRLVIETQYFKYESNGGEQKHGERGRMGRTGR